MTIRNPARIALLAAAALAGCAQLIGFPDYGTGGSGGTGGHGGGGHGGTATSTTTTTTTTSSSSGDAGCLEGAACYDGPAVTEGVGACHAGALSCGADGGACVGEVLPSAEDCTTGDVDESCDGIATCTGQFRWATTLPGAATANLVAAGADGTVVAVGTPGPNTGIAFVDVFDAEGRPCWSAPASLGNASMPTVVARAVAVAGAGPASARASCAAGPLAASTVVAGQVNGPIAFGGGSLLTPVGPSDSFVALLDPTGKVVWGKVFGSGGTDAAYGVAASADGYVYVTGWAQGGPLNLACPDMVDGGAPPGAGAYVAKLALADGSCVWAATFGASSAAGTGVTVNALGNVVVVGNFSNMLNLGGTQLTTTVNSSTFVVQLTPDGTISGATSYTCGNTETIQIAAGPAPAAHVFVSGTILHGLSDATNPELCPDAGAQQAYLLEIDPTLMTTLTWVCYGTGYIDGGTGDTTSYGVGVDGAGNAALLLGGSGAIQNPQRPFTPPLSAAGVVAFKLSPTPAPAYATLVWQTPVSTSAPPIFNAALAVDGLGNVVIAGTGAGALNLGGTTLDAGAGAGFIVELAP